jgi:hypothetical protein
MRAAQNPLRFTDDETANPTEPTPGDDTDPP